MEIANGAAFADVAARAIAAKAATADGDDAYHPRKDYLPQIAEAIALLKAGQLAALVRIQAGYVVVKVLDVRYPENPEARAEARRRALDQQREAAMAAHQKILRRDQAVVHEAVLKGIDYESAKPGIDALMKDKRVVAEIKGAAPVTVADLTDFLRLQFFHGTDDAGSRKRMNARKEDALEATLARRLLNAEALRLGIDKTGAYRDRVNGYTDSLVFDAFLQKVIVPESKMREEEVDRYYDSHLKEYSTPEMLRIRSLAFTRRNAAEVAMRKLREGADFGWLAANAEGQAGKGAQGVLTFDGRPVTTGSMPDGLQKALAGAKAGESRLYASPEGFVYVLVVQQVIAPVAKPYAEVRETIAKKLYDEKIKKGVEEYANKLRAQSKVETYLKRAQ
jgi:parvulin-like peptidyl-prolyl isomerase